MSTPFPAPPPRGLAYALPGAAELCPGDCDLHLQPVNVLHIQRVSLRPGSLAVVCACFSLDDAPDLQRVLQASWFRLSFSASPASLRAFCLWIHCFKEEGLTTLISAAMYPESSMPCTFFLFQPPTGSSLIPTICQCFGRGSTGFLP